MLPGGLCRQVRPVNVAHTRNGVVLRIVIFTFLEQNVKRVVRAYRPTCKQNCGKNVAWDAIRRLRSSFNVELTRT